MKIENWHDKGDGKSASDNSYEAILEDYVVDMSDEFGCVHGEPLLMARELSVDEIQAMDAHQLRQHFLVLQTLYQAAWSKLGSPEVPKELKRRDPGALWVIVEGAEAGRTDEDLADQLGESVKWVQALRLEAAHMLGIPELREKRGRRPKKST